jgi:hypothetical protein
MLRTDRRHIQWRDINKKKVASSGSIKRILRGKKSGNDRGDLRFVICIPEGTCRCEKSRLAFQLTRFYNRLRRPK